MNGRFSPVLAGFLGSVLASSALTGCATPTTGDYLFAAEGDITTDCTGTTQLGTDDVTPTITVADDGSNVVFGAGAAAIECPLDGTTFVCAYEGVTDYQALTGADALVTIRSDLDGTWVTSKKIKGTSGAAIECEGSDCASIEAMGFEFCSASQEYEATLQE